jgi:hypothetical protein
MRHFVNTADPSAAASSFDTLSGKVEAFLQAAKFAAAGGLTWAEFGTLLLSLLRLVVTSLDSVTTLSGAEKKELVLEAAAALFDTIADRAVPPAVWPLWILVRPAIRSLVLAIASGAIESLLPLVRKANA